MFVRNSRYCWADDDKTNISVRGTVFFSFPDTADGITNGNNVTVRRPRIRSRRVGERIVPETKHNVAAPRANVRVDELFWRTDGTYADCRLRAVHARPIEIQTNILTRAANRIVRDIVRRAKIDKMRGVLERFNLILA